MQQAQRWCLTCERLTLHQRPHLEAHWGCIFTLISGCVFLPVWALIALVQCAGTWRCQTCGSAASLAYAPQPRLPPAPSLSPTGPPLSERIEDGFQGAARLALRGYTNLPEWAQPIIWGLGLAAAIVALVALVRISS